MRRSDDGDISIFDERDNFIASFKRGQWIDDLVFQTYELEEFTIIEDEVEIFRVLAEARKALGKPLANS